jgi:excisionase family DNA binding protein
MRKTLVEPPALPPARFQCAGIKLYELTDIERMFPEEQRPCRETFLRAIRKGTLRARRKGRSYVVTEQALQEWLLGAA